jgi:putative zinc finger/helix-turn-helix YgiT family protein
LHRGGHSIQGLHDRGERLEEEVMKCADCGAPVTVSYENYRYKECGLDNVVLGNIKIRTCKSCGERELVIPKIQELHGLLAKSIAGQPARLTPKEIRFLRKYLGFSSADFAKEMGVAAETVSRWESGHSPKPMNRQADRLLRLMVIHGKPIEYYPAKADEGAGKKPAPLKVRITRCAWEVAS